MILPKQYNTIYLLLRRKVYKRHYKVKINDSNKLFYPTPSQILVVTRTHTCTHTYIHTYIHTHTHKHSLVEIVIVNSNLVLVNIGRNAII